MRRTSPPPRRAERGCDVHADTAPATAADRLLQDELRDLRSLVINADHIRWVTIGADSAALDTLLHTFADDWRELSDRVAHCLVAHGSPPDGRVSTLTDVSKRGWLPGGSWIAVDDARQWVCRELANLASWAHTRGEEVGDAALAPLFTEVERCIGAELDQFAKWWERHERSALLDEVGRESFPASDPPSSWAGHEPG